MSPLDRSRAGIDRRLALKLLASALAAGSTAACGPPDEEILPYAEMPEGLVAGEPRRYATTFTLSGYGRGVLGISVDGRPVKIEGNPGHPFSLGATDVFAEAEVLSLYDPDRSAVVRHQGAISSWPDFSAAWEKFLSSATEGKPGIVTGRLVAPTTLRLIEALRRRLPDLLWYRYEPVNDDRARAGSRLAFGKVLDALPRLEEADVVLCLDADPLGPGPELLRNARAFAIRKGKEPRQALHAVETTWSLTGGAADYRLAMPPARIAEVARVVASRLGADLGKVALSGEELTFAERVAEALQGAVGKALVLVGESQPAEVHALCHWINRRLQAPLDYRPSPDPVEADHGAALGALAKDLAEGRISALMIAGANPVYDAPDALGLAKAIAALPFSVQLGMYEDETARCCQWHLPLSHPLESWGDALAPDGTASLVQPLIRRLHDSRTQDETLALLSGDAAAACDLIRETWRPRSNGDFEVWWRRCLHDGVIAKSAPAPLRPPEPRFTKLPSFGPRSDMELVLGPHPSIWDGRYAANAWLQECGQPFTRQVWGNALRVAPEDARLLGLEERDTVEIRIGDREFVMPAISVPGQAKGVVFGTWGYGRTEGARIARGLGSRLFGLTAEAFPRVIPGLSLAKSQKSIPFHSIQDQTRLAGATADLFKIAIAGEAPEPPADSHPPSLLPHPERGAYAWGMVVDTDACIGCNACVIACQAENNVPVVGPEEISLGRDMHWLRVDSYALDEGQPARQGFQPVPCMHCELAPCEPVCPVEASIHDHGGLNVQVYNRCIGTRFCEANCPYKVRRFNWFAYGGAQAYAGDGEALKAQHNPDVSVRGRGVMEKCNYCLQRISRARRTAEKEDRHVAEGEMVTACQAACPTRAIHFGDLNLAEAEVTSLRRSPRHYVLLEELNTRPRTTYLKRVYPGDSA